VHLCLEFQYNAWGIQQLSESHVAELWIANWPVAMHLMWLLCFWVVCCCCAALYSAVL
jgi:hypothetical protein